MTAPPLRGTTSVSGTTITFTPGATFFSGTDTFDYTTIDADGDGISDHWDVGCASRTDDTEVDASLVCDDGVDKVLGVSGPVLTFSVPEIHSVRIRGDNGTISFDNLEFGTLVAVPEASAAAMLALAGLVWGRCARTGTRSAADSTGAAGGTRRR